MINESKVRRKYEFFINQANRLLKQNKLDDSFDCARLACVLAKNYYLCYEENRLEMFIHKVAKKLEYIKKGYKYVKGDRIVFYDTHTTDNIALTQQYIGALISWNVEFLYITPKDLNGNNTQLISRMIDSYEKASVCIIPANYSSIDTIKFIFDSAMTYSPNIAIIQTTADDIEGTVAWKLLEEIERFYIDLSDHSFWVGASVYDYFIEFRNYGVNICTDHRGIQQNKILMQPFYPVSQSKDYKGLPVPDNKFKILSGGRLEKIYGQNDKYFHLIKTILEKNPDTILCFVGGGAFGKSGETSYITKKWKELGIENRVFMLGFRDDIVEVYKHMDLYIGTYPMGGGLMSQIAASQGLPIVQYASDGLSMCLGEFLLSDKKHRQFVFINDEVSFLKEVSFLINNDIERHHQGEQLKKLVISKEKFDSQLSQVIYRKRDNYERMKYQVDCKKLRENQFELENNCHHSYYRIMVKSKYLRKRHPMEYIANLILFIKYSDKKWLLKKVRKK